MVNAEIYREIVEMNGKFDGHDFPDEHLRLWQYALDKKGDEAYSSILGYIYARCITSVEPREH